MIRPKVSKSSLARAFSGGMLITEPSRSYDLPVSHKPPPSTAAAAPSASNAPAGQRFAYRAALLFRIVNTAVLASVCWGVHSAPLRVHRIVWTPRDSSIALMPAPAGREGCTTVQSPIYIAGLVALTVALFDTWATPGLRHVAGILAGCVAAGCADADVVVLSCIAVTLWPTNRADATAAVAWALPWAIQLGALSAGVVRGGDRMPLLQAGVTVVALAAECIGERMSHVKGLVAEVFTAVLFARMRNATVSSLPCSAD